MEECALCLDELCQPVSPFQCKHLYHKNCIVQWRSTAQPMAQKCPLCCASVDTDFDRSAIGREILAGMALAVTGIGVGALVYEAAASAMVVVTVDAGVTGGAAVVSSVASPCALTLAGAGAAVGAGAAFAAAGGLALHRFCPGFITPAAVVFERVDGSTFENAKSFIVAEKGIGKVHFFPFRNIDGGRRAMLEGIRDENDVSLLRTKAPWGNSRILYVLLGGVRAAEVDARGPAMPLNSVRQAAKAACLSQYGPLFVL
mmetsp:Transcript_15925/g.32639  ORF Transcript_15925/g.32639 Transcript_15925/m.32639 type:complete len:258 (-) Transcript_15925:99-872(-)